MTTLSLLIARSLRKKFHSSGSTRCFFYLLLIWALISSISTHLVAGSLQPVNVTVSADAASARISPDFLGLSYESSMLLPQEGRYYFDADDKALVNTFKTLGIKSLRIGGNAADDERVQVPQEKDIDALFKFARAAGVKVIYSFRLKKGDPAVSARLAAYIASHYADTLDCFAIGNEPAFFFKTFEEFLAQWKNHYQAILKVVPNAMFDGPSVAGENIYAIKLADAVFAEGHLKMASDHWYFLGSGRDAEKDPTQTRARFLSNDVHTTYDKSAYQEIGAVLAAKGVPYRLDEMNSCYNGGAKDSSDTYTSTLWALDCLHWWAAHHILGMNFHTGESVGRDGGFAAPNYAVFLRHREGSGFTMRPLAYAFLAFNEGARGHALPVKTNAPPSFNFNAYAFRDDRGSFYLTLINKTYGDKSEPAGVIIELPKDAGQGTWQRMVLGQENSDVAAKTGVALAGSSIDPQGNWTGKWEKLANANSASANILVSPASATVLQFVPAK